MMKNAKRKPTHKQILAELMKKPRITEAAKELHGDIEDSIAEAGGQRGSLRCANG
jgi:hypothetical protein